MSFYLQTNSVEHLGTYEFRVRAYIIHNGMLLVQGFVTVRVQIIPADAIPNTAPYFIKEVENVKMYYSSNALITLPDIKDNEGD